MSRIISIYPMPFSDNDDVGIFTTNFNIEWFKINDENNILVEFLKWFEEFFKNLCRYNDMGKIELLNKLSNEITDEERNIILNFQLNNGILTQDFINYKGDDYILPEIDYFSKDYFIFRVDDIKEDNIIFKEVDEIDNGKHIILIKGETIVNKIDRVLTILMASIQKGVIKTKAQLFITFVMMMQDFLLYNSNIINEKSRFDINVLRAVLRIKLSNKPGLYKKIEKSFIDYNNFMLLNVLSKSVLFEYIIYINKMPKEIEKYIKSLIEMLNNDNVTSLATITGNFGAQNLKPCQRC